MTDTAATAPKKTKSPEKLAKSKAERLIARALPTLEGEATNEDMKARREAGKAKYEADAKAIVKALTKGGMTFQYNEADSAKTKRVARKASKAESAEG